MSKKQWKNVDLSLQFSIKSDWSQEEVDAPLSDVHSIRSSLPTKTNATRQTAELDNIPENGPFILNFANMPFDASETDLRQFFRAFTIVGIEFNNPKRGCGQIEFTNLADLAGAWKLNEKTFINRPLRLSIPLKEDMIRQQALGGRPKYQSQQKPSTLNSDDSDNWRSRKPQPQSQKESSSFPKPDENANWRGRGQRTDEGSSEPISVDESAWRNRPAKTAEAQAPESSAWRTQQPQAREMSKLTDSNTGDKNAWRNRQPREGDGVKTADIDESTNWRSRGNPPITKTEPEAEPVSIAWRKGAAPGNTIVGSTEVDRNKPSVSKVIAESTCQGEQARSGEEEPDSGKKRSIFGDAKPVDTSAKYLEAEAKIEQTKIAKVDSPKAESMTWKKNINQSVPVPGTDKSNVPLEWREKKPLVPSTAGKDTPANIKTELPAEQVPRKVERPVAPPPTVNVWEERKKSKIGGQITVVKNISQKNEDTKKEEVKKIQMRQEEVKKDDKADVTKVIIVPEKEEIVQCKEVPLVDELEVRAGVVSADATKAKMVVSANGPFLDPKSHKVAPQHIVTQESTATPTPTATVAPAAQRLPSACSSSSNPWARGPPRGLLETSHASDRQ